MLITNARLVNEGQIREVDVLLRNGRIERIDAQIGAEHGQRVLDARGRLLLPGMIDDQVHFREPGLTHKGDMASESAAAVAGGITSFMDMPNVKPTTTTRERLAEKYLLAADRCHANYAFYLGAANDNAEEIAACLPDEACAIKIFMGASTGNMLVDDPATLEDMFIRAQLPVVTHCEHTPTILANEALARERFGDAIPVTEHPLIRSREACYRSSAFAVALARRHRTLLHVLHLTTAEELALFSAGPVGDKQITVEACVHHLSLDDRAYPSLGNRIKCNPAIKAASDRLALLQAVRDDIIDVIATDHAPHTAEEKARTDYATAPGGLPLVQHALLLLFDLVANGELDLHQVVRKTSHAVADRFGIVERGYVREGYWADLTLIDPQLTTTVTPDSIRYKCGWSPFEGRVFPARIDATWVNGELAYCDGEVNPQRLGQRLRFRALR